MYSRWNVKCELYKWTIEVEKQTIAGKCFNFTLDSKRRKLTIWPKRTSMSKSFIANYRDERLFMCKWAIKGECNLSSRCATIVKSRDSDVNATRGKEAQENKCRLPRTPIRKLIYGRGTLHENLYLGKWQHRRSLAERNIYCRLKLWNCLTYKRTDNKAEAGSMVVAVWRNIQIIYDQNRTHESRGGLLPRYVGGIARRTFHPRCIRIYVRIYSKKEEFPRFWISCHSLRWPYITAPLSQRARCLILRREVVHSER